MPDEFEIPETPEATESHKERIVGLIIAAIAVVLAIITHVGNETNNDKILAHVDASDQYAHFQSKKERGAQLELQSELIQLLSDKFSPEKQDEATKLLTKYEGQIKHLEDDEKEIKEKADDYMADSHTLQGRARFVEPGEIALQVAIVLCSITILTEQFLFVRMGVAIAIAGALAALWGIFMVH